MPAGHKRRNPVSPAMLAAIAVVLVVIFLACSQANQNYTTGVNCPNDNCKMPGSSCGTVNPGYRDQCCAERNANTVHIMCVGDWKYAPESNQCIYSCRQS